MFAGFLIFKPEDKNVPTPATYKLVAVINPTVVIPEELIFVKFELVLDKVVTVAIPTVILGVPVNP